MDLHKLRQFLALARTSSYARASVELNLSQPALTRSIQSLERHLGTRLFERDRGRSGVVLTRAGYDLAARATDLIRQADAIEREVSQAGLSSRQRLSFGVPPLLASVVLKPYLSRMLVLRPDIELSIVVGHTDALATQLLTGELDFLIGLAPRSRMPPHIRHRTFVVLRPKFLIRPGHPLAGRRRVSVREVSRYPLLTGTGWSESLFSLDEEFDPRLFQPTIRLDSYGILAELVLESDSIMVSSVAPDGARLIEIDLDPESISGAVSKLLLFSLAGIGHSKAASDAVAELRSMYLERVDSS